MPDQRYDNNFQYSGHQYIDFQASVEKSYRNLIASLNDLNTKIEEANLNLGIWTVVKKDFQLKMLSCSANCKNCRIVPIFWLRPSQPLLQLLKSRKSLQTSKLNRGYQFWENTETLNMNVIG